MVNSPFKKGQVLFLNPRTCGIYKSGGVRYRVGGDGQRTREIDNELLEHVDAVLGGKRAPGQAIIPVRECLERRNFTPRYYDPRWDEDFDALLETHKLEGVSLGDLEHEGVISVQGGHGSPSNDQRSGTIPYIKVSDLRNLRVNINPTNMIPRELAERRFWRGPDSGLQGWDLLTPNRASSNIGEFVVLLPGEEEIVLTKEVFRVRCAEDRSDGWDPFYLLWALCLRAVRQQWQRVTLMQTNREDVSQRYREIRLPRPSSPEWARAVSEPFRQYFTSVAAARQRFVEELHAAEFRHIASIYRLVPGGDNTDEEALDPTTLDPERADE